jgi:hypothetical protein
VTNGSERLDETKLETLRKWGEGLGSDGREEVRAAGKAIVLLVEEVERLHIDLWHARGGDVADDDEPGPEGEPSRGLFSDLRSRLMPRTREEGEARVPSADQ